MTTIRFQMRNVAAIAACLTVTMFASCKKDPKILDLNGTVSISPTPIAFTGDELAATYSGSEAVTWQWNKGGEAISGATANKYKPADAGTYSVTASAKGYNSKSATVDVLKPFVLDGVQTYYEWDGEPVDNETMGFSKTWDFLTGKLSELTTLIPGSFAKLENGLLYITLKKPNALYPFSLLGIEGVNGSNLNANVFIIQNIIYNENGWDIWHYYKSVESSSFGGRNETYLIYTEEDILITGVRETNNNEDMHINLALKKGWNWVTKEVENTIRSGIWSTKIPNANYKWYLGG